MNTLTNTTSRGKPTGFSLVYQTL